MTECFFNKVAEFKHEKLVLCKINQNMSMFHAIQNPVSFDWIPLLGEH